MAPTKAKEKKHAGAEKSYTEYPSPYGSHSSMISKEYTEQLTDDKFVVLLDGDGLYVTERCRLDTRMADSYRWGEVEMRAKILKRHFPSWEVKVENDKVIIKK